MATKKENESLEERLARAREQTEAAQQAYNELTGAGYTPSEEVAGLKNEYRTLRERLANYAPYSNPNAAAMHKALTAIVNRPAFQFSTDGDALYERYKNNYQAMGKRAMEDTIGQAAMLTGGYSNSYAATAGAQAYNDYLAKMDDVVPTLYNLALSKYQTEGDALKDRYSVLSADDQRLYDRWLGERGILADLADRAQNDYITERGYDYTTSYADRLAALENNFSMNTALYDNAYREQQDALDRAAAEAAAASVGRSGGVPVPTRSGGESYSLGYADLSSGEKKVIDRLAEGGDEDSLIDYLYSLEQRTGKDYGYVLDDLKTMGYFKGGGTGGTGGTGGAGAMTVMVGSRPYSVDGNIYTDLQDGKKYVRVNGKLVPYDWSLGGGGGGGSRTQMNY